MSTTRESKSDQKPELAPKLQLPIYPEEGGYTLEVWHQLAEKAGLHSHLINDKYVREQLHVLGKVIKAMQDGQATKDYMLQLAIEAINKNSKEVLRFLIEEKLIDVNEIVTDYSGNKAAILHFLGHRVDWVKELLTKYAFKDDVLNLKVRYAYAPRVICSSSCSKDEWDVFMGDKPPSPFLPAPTSLLEMLIATSSDYFMSFSSTLNKLFEKGDINLAGAIYYAYIAIQNKNVLLNVLDLFKEKIEKTKFNISPVEKAFLDDVLAAELVESKAESPDLEKKSDTVKTTLLQKTTFERFDFYYLQLAKQAYDSADNNKIFEIALEAVKYGYQQTFEFISKLKDSQEQPLLDINKKFRGGRYGAEITFPMLAADNQRWGILTSILTHPAILANTVNFHSYERQPTILEKMIDHYAAIFTLNEKEASKKGKTQIKINEKLKEPIKCFLKAGGLPIDKERYLITKYIYQKFYTEHWESGECHSWVENGRTRYHTPAWIVVNDHRKHPQIKELYQILSPYTRQYSCHVRACNKVTQVAKSVASSVHSLFCRKSALPVHDKTTPRVESKRP